MEDFRYLVALQRNHVYIYMQSLLYPRKSHSVIYSHGTQAQLSALKPINLSFPPLSFLLLAGTSTRSSGIDCFQFVHISNQC